MTRPPYYAFGQRIRRLRLSMNMTQRALAVKAGITSVYMNRIEAGHNMPSVDTITRLARILKTTRGALLK